MSAALVESVREAKDAETMQTLEIALYKLDLPAILAALTEAEALRAQVAAGQAREVALREALNDLYGYAHRQAPLSRFEGGVPVALLKGLNALSAPTDTAALRAFGERCWDAGYDEGRWAFGERREQIDHARATDIDRVLGGS